MKINVLSMHHPFMWCVYECWFTLINHFNSNDDDSLELVYNFKFHKLFFLKSSFLAHYQVNRYKKMFFPVLCLVKSSFFFNIIFIRKISIHASSICIQFFFNWNLVHLLNCIQIQLKLHTMSFTIFIWMELNFHKINSFFSSIDHHRYCTTMWNISLVLRIQSSWQR
jgi:hypothetical protein